MRVSTNMLYDRGVTTIQQQSADLLKTQQQVATGRRILTPADDPINSARSLETSQSKATNRQFIASQGYAEDKLRLLENRLDGVGDILQYVREKMVQAGNPVLSERERGFLAADLRAQYEALLSLANSKDANNEYLFSGYRSQTQPFQGGFGGIQYFGDEGGRSIKVTPTRLMPVGVPGSDVFLRTRVLDSSMVSVTKMGSNLGDAQLSLDPISIPAIGGVRYVIAYDSVTSAYTATRRAPGGPDIDVAVTISGAPPDAISFDGLTFALAGSPEGGDRFEVFTASTGIFDNLAAVIDALERPSHADRNSQVVAFGLQNLDPALESILKVRAQIGSQLVELGELRKVGEDLDIQYAQTLSRLQDVDLAEAISRLTRQQTLLEAAQASFVRVTGLSLFNFIS